MADVKKFPITHSQRELNRRGKMSLSCMITDRWIKVGDPVRGISAEYGTPIEIEVMAAYSPSTGGDRKLCSLTVSVDQLRALLAEIDKR